MQPDIRAAVVQDTGSGRVLMLAWMDDEALRLTRETGQAHFFSRSRERLWRKGETSGNTLAVEELREDCDGDAILLRVSPNGPACHTGSLSCFAPWLWRRVAERARERPAGSYVAGLLDEGDEVPAGHGLRDDLHVGGALERAADTGEDEAVVVGDGDAEGLLLGHRLRAVAIQVDGAAGRQHQRRQDHA